MKQKGWILLAVLALLVALTFVRERFEATPSIKKPPYGSAEIDRIWNMVSSVDRETLVRQLDGFPQFLDAVERWASGDDGKFNRPLPKRPTNDSTETRTKKAISSYVAAFYTKKYAPATTPLTPEDVNGFVSELVNGGNMSSQFIKPVKDVLKTYFIDQSGVGTSVTTGYATKVTDMAQLPGYLGAGSPLEMRPSPFPTKIVPPTPLPGRESIPVSGSSAPSPVPGGGMGTITGSSTGGSSTSSMGPTSGNAGSRSKQVFGPVFTSRGEGGNPGNGGDSTKSNNYPELMGGRGGGVSTKIAGAGVVPPSKNWLLTNDGSLPSWESLGAMDMSKYFPTSRTPGDMDLIPDPYRLSRNFSTSSYSSKTEPAPFLTDFSAFLK